MTWKGGFGIESINRNLRADEFLSWALKSIRTTLYELVEAISEEPQPGEDWMVTETTLDIGGIGTRNEPV